MKRPVVKSQYYYPKVVSVQSCLGVSRALLWFPSEALWSHPLWSQSLKPRDAKHSVQIKIKEEGGHSGYS